jgi:hypothetical protein
MTSCPLFPWTTSSAAAVDSCHIHSSSPLAISDQVQGVGYSESEVETDATDLKLEIDAAALELEMDIAGLELERDIIVLDFETEIDVY